MSRSPAGGAAGEEPVPAVPQPAGSLAAVRSSGPPAPRAGRRRGRRGGRRPRLAPVHQAVARDQGPGRLPQVRHAHNHIRQRPVSVVELAQVERCSLRWTNAPDAASSAGRMSWPLGKARIPSRGSPRPASSASLQRRAGTCLLLLCAPLLRCRLLSVCKVSLKSSPGYRRWTCWSTSLQRAATPSCAWMAE